MFSIIRDNQRKSAVLIVAMGLGLVAVGYAFGVLMDPGLGPFGMLVAAGLWVIMLAVSFSSGESMLLAQAGGREIRKADAPRLFNVVEEMQIAAGLGRMPRVYLIDSPVPNAFAVGRNEERAAVAVTTGLMARLNRDELQGVIAHEIAHIRNRDTLFMTIAATTMGAIVILADLYVRGLRYSSFRPRRSSSSRGGGQAAAVMALLAVLLAILAPLLAQLLYFACSRRREYLADACAAQFTRYPEGLASALAKIAGGQKPDAQPSRVLAPMYIVSPLAADGPSSSLFSTHPPTRDRIRVLRAMTQGASLAVYEEAYRATHGNRGVLGANLAASEAVALREAGPEPAAPALGPAWREARAAAHHADGLRRVDCHCGLRFRVPPDPNLAAFPCPRCGYVHRLQAS